MGVVTMTVIVLVYIIDNSGAAAGYVCTWADLLFVLDALLGVILLSRGT